MIITDIKQQKYNKNRYSIFVDNVYTFSLEDIDIFKLKLKIGQEITEEDIELYKQKYEYAKARDKALGFVTYKKRSIKEVVDKLGNLGYSDDVILKVINKLLELKYLNDNDYAESFIKEKLKLKPSGRNLLKYELRNKGIDDAIIEKNIEKFEIDEYEIAFNLVLRKFSDIKVFDEKNKRKIYSFLLRRGFSNNVAIHAINKFKDGDYEI